MFPLLSIGMGGLPMDLCVGKKDTGLLQSMSLANYHAFVVISVHILNSPGMHHMIVL